MKNKTEDALEETISALARLDELAAVNEQFQKDLFLVVIDPILLPSRNGYSHGIQVLEGSICLEPEPSPASVRDVLDRVGTVLAFLHHSLPLAIQSPLSDTFIPAISSKIISHWLSTAIPTELEGLGWFEATLNHVLGFTKLIGSLNWHGQEELLSWVNQAPRLWLTRRRIDSLDQVRKVLSASKGDSRQVERVEKRQVHASDEVLLDNSTLDDWDAGWDDQNHDDEVVSAWGLDNDKDDSKAAKASAGVDDEEDDGAEDAWGWAEDDEEDQSFEDTAPNKAVTEAKPSQDQKHKSQSGPREITLKEHYTAAGRRLCGHIATCVSFLNKCTKHFSLTSTRNTSTLVSSSGAGLLALPTLILAMFKATASSFYSLKLNCGQMYLYNDSLYLSERVREVADENQLPRLYADVDALARFGKLAYSKEMQTQRTIVTDLLDGAQGFSQCSEQPFLGECENAVSATVDRLQDVYAEWQPILSHSALLQAIGSLVSTVINKIIIDIVDLGDISEAQSQKLVSFCNQLSRLERLFLPANSDSNEPVPMTAVYVRNWLKFQYLINILESSIADIKFLWVEGELSLEFSADEVVDLIEALFAESDYRRKAIAEIRRASKGT
jgi:centromere/kinetochore protein ZW10